MVTRDAEEERRLVDQLRVYQLQKLEARRAHGHWGDDSVSALFAKLRKELEELHFELFYRPGTPEQIARECADVANYAAMIADVVKARCTPPATAEPGEGK